MQNRCVSPAFIAEDEVRIAAERLVDFHVRFAPLFGKEKAQDHSHTYIKGLMVCPEHKSIEPIALNVGDGQVLALQKSLDIAPRSASSKGLRPTADAPHWCPFDGSSDRRRSRDFDPSNGSSNF